MKNSAIVYKLHKNNSPTIIIDLTEEEADIKLIEVQKDYPKAYITTREKALKVLDEFGKQFEPKPLSQQERWNKWALGK
jgi:hypothetical protein